MKKILIAASVLVLASCNGPAKSVTDKDGYEIEFLFQQDGCNMYRFYDSGTKWFMTCPDTNSVTWAERTGKTTQRREVITARK